LSARSVEHALKEYLTTYARIAAEASALAPFVQHTNGEATTF
jgi:hypothetical protein